MWHKLDGNMIAADKFYERKAMCDLVDLEEGGYYCNECCEEVDEPCEDQEDE